MNRERIIAICRVDILDLLQLMLIGLKLAKVINWPGDWLWVLAPTWISISLFIIIFTIIYIVNKIKFKRDAEFTDIEDDIEEDY